MKSKACSSFILDAATKNAEHEIQMILTKVGFQRVDFDTSSPSVVDACQLS
jgi:hypothetical protein